jgi:hypothetical protein
MGQRLAGFVYGTILTLSVIVAGARAYPHSAGHIAALVAVTCAVFWIAHVYAHGLGHGVAHGEHLTLRELRMIARREGSIVEAAVPPVLALLLCSGDSATTSAEATSPTRVASGSRPRPTTRTATSRSVTIPTRCAPSSMTGSEPTSSSSISRAASRIDVWGVTARGRSVITSAIFLPTGDLLLELACSRSRFLPRLHPNPGLGQARRTMR